MYYKALSIVLIINILNAKQETNLSPNTKRNYGKAQKEVKDTYKKNHTYQTLGFVLNKEAEYYPRQHGIMTVWEAIEQLADFIDSSDPDLQLGQIHHAMQTAEKMKEHNLPDWLILTGFIHDLGKILYLFGEPQWAVVGDTFPLGCAFSQEIVYPEYFKYNPDTNDTRFNTKFGIYKPHCGLENVHMSWGHDEYLYHIVKDHLPKEACYIIRYHSFYAQHTKNAYPHLMNEHDKQMMEWVKLFNKYDLYTKDAKPVDVKALTPYYKKLVEKYFPTPLNW